LLPSGPQLQNQKAMKTDHYNDLNDKCQCITFDESGKVTGSNDTLFQASRLTLSVIRQHYPFLWKIIKYLRSHENEKEPLFFPGVEFEFNGYYSVCDFTFMKSVDALGIKRFIWMIYDNSIHYRDLITSERKPGSCKIKLQF
jgi:hypothetical protein